MTVVRWLLCDVTCTFFPDSLTNDPTSNALEAQNPANGVTGSFKQLHFTAYNSHRTAHNGLPELRASSRRVCDRAEGLIEG